LNITNGTHSIWLPIHRSARSFNSRSSPGPTPYFRSTSPPHA